MDKQVGFIKNLAILGCMLVWFPLLAPVFLSMTRLIQSGSFHLDYLMPAELFLSVLFGGLLLVWSAYRAHLRLKFILWSFVAAIALLFGGQALALITGLATGETASGGWQWAVVLGMIFGYILALVVLALEGLLLLRDLYQAGRQAPVSRP